MEGTDPYANPDSMRFKFRQRRFQLISSLIDKVVARKGSCRVLDIGGTETYWLIGADYVKKKTGQLQIALLNLEAGPVADAKIFSSMKGDACDLREFPDQSFDLVHSNSVLEHVGSWARMKAMAAEVRRLAPHFYVQTPYFWFPVEPHYNSLAFHWLPQNIQAARLRARAYGFCDKQPDIDAATDLVQHTVLLDKRQFAHLFPDAEFQHEKFYGLTKSLIAVR